jgi:hypothetical protein
MEIPVALMVFLWTVLLCLRADDTIFINYHLVNLPMYLACAHLFVGLLLTDFWYYLRDSFETRIHFKVKCTMTLVAEEIVPITKRRKYTLYGMLSLYFISCSSYCSCCSLIVVGILSKALDMLCLQRLWRFSSC